MRITILSSDPILYIFVFSDNSNSAEIILLKYLVVSKTCRTFVLSKGASPSDT
nr:MAG TPA: hypothetical protein [Caudoviricetes sp.]